MQRTISVIFFISLSAPASSNKVYFSRYVEPPNAMENNLEHSYLPQFEVIKESLFQ